MKNLMGSFRRGKAGVCLVLAVCVLVFAAPPRAVAATGPTYSWATGSFFSTNVTAGYFAIDGASLYVTNALWVTNCSTNLLATSIVSNLTAGAGGMGLMVDAIGDRAPGATNNGFIRLVFARSLSLGAGPWTTGSNALVVDFPVLGNTRNIWSTNIPTAWLDGFGEGHDHLLVSGLVGLDFFGSRDRAHIQVHGIELEFLERCDHRFKPERGSGRDRALFEVGRDVQCKVHHLDRAVRRIFAVVRRINRRQEAGGFHASDGGGFSFSTCGGEQ